MVRACEKSLDEIENIRAIVKMKMKRHGGRPRLIWKDTVRRDTKTWKIWEKLVTEREKWKAILNMKVRKSQHVCQRALKEPATQQ